ncbi:MAG: MBOAT family protein [Eubacterium sp.]|nr:MBOAT family protein [Eubacterium sp.]
MALCFICYYISRKTTYRNIVLVVFSLIFYAWGEPAYVFLLLASVTVNYVAGLYIDKFRDTKKSTAITALALIFNIGVLVFFKYTGFFVENFNAISPLKLPVPDITMPIGISFFTFQIISYILDCYWGKIKVQKNYFKLLMYISLFPQLIAGPIVRYSTIEDQIDNRKISPADITEGISRICIGLGKKVILADNLYTIVDTLFAAGSLGSLSVLGTWYGVIAYAMQVYFDFSGYSDIAIGLGRMFGFRFDENFRYPFISKNITEFWQRWHISLGSFFRDYLLYVPIFGKRRQYLNLFLVWFCTGFWHGASWNYIIWGLYFGFFILIERMIGNKNLKKIPLAVTHIYSKLVIIVGFGIFYFEDIGQLGVFLGNLIGANGNALTDQISLMNMASNCCLLILCIICCLPLIPTLRKKYKELSQSDMFVYARTAACLLIFLLSSVLMVNNTDSPFIYWHF